MSPATITPLQKPVTKSKIGQFNRSIESIMKDFEKPIPQRLLKSKTIKGNRITFIPWYSYVRLLNYYCPGWSWDVRIVPCEGRTAIEGRLTIRAAEGDFSMMATGNEHDDTDAYGDPVSNAEAMALRRACAKFGLGLHLWEK